MTLPLNSRLSALYDTNGTQKDFGFGFRVFFDPDNGGYGLEVRRQTADGYEIIPKSDYLVLPVEDNSAGIVRFNVAPSAGQQIYIAGKTPTIQQLVLTNFGRYSAESIETQFDFITAIIQEWLSALGEETAQRINGDLSVKEYTDQVYAGWQAWAEANVPTFAETYLYTEITDFRQQWTDAMNSILTGRVPALVVDTSSGQTQQQINDFGGAKWYAMFGGYDLGATIKLDSGDIVKSTIPNNTNNPNLDMTGWEIVGTKWIDITGLLLSGETAKTWNTTVLNNAITKAKAESKGIHCSPRGSVHLEGNIDALGVTHIHFYTDIINAAGTFIIGGQANTGKPFSVNFENLTNGTSALTGVIPAIDVLRLEGVKGGTVTVGSCNLIRVHAIGGNTTRGSNAYFRMFINGSVRAFRVSDEGTNGWNNEFEVRGGRLIDLDITGTGYVPNNIVFDNNVWEGNLVKINFKKAWTNRIVNARFEGAVSSSGITFAPDTMQNTVIQKWSGTGSTRSMFDIGIPVIDNGQGNQVTTQNAIEFNQTELFSVTGNSVILANSTDSAYVDSRIGKVVGAFVKPLLSPSLFGFSSPAQKYIATSEMISVEIGDVVKFDCNYVGNLLRPVVFIYDANQRLITTGSGHISMIGGAFNASQGSYSVGSDQSATSINNGGFNVATADVKYIRVSLYTNTGGFFKNVSATLYTQKLFRSGTTGSARSINVIPELNGLLTQGYAPRGTKYLNTQDKKIYTCTNALDTSISAINGSVLTLRNVTGVQVGDIVGLARTNGATAWGTVTAISGSDVTVSNASDVEVNARCVINHWQSYDKQAEGLTSASTTAQIVAALQAAGLAT